jgi:hypothetical protein
MASHSVAVDDEYGGIEYGASRSAGQLIVRVSTAIFVGLFSQSGQSAVWTLADSSFFCCCRVSEFVAKSHARWRMVANSRPIGRSSSGHPAVGAAFGVVSVGFDAEGGRGIRIDDIDGFAADRGVLTSTTHFHSSSDVSIAFPSSTPALLQATSMRPNVSCAVAASASTAVASWTSVGTPMASAPATRSSSTA